MMADLCHAFLALPGGIGTLEEFFEVLTWRQLAIHQQPIGLLNTAGYYDLLMAFLAHSQNQGFSYSLTDSTFFVSDSIDAVLDQLC
jgi:uncharacterized protein (TIGR00730 family)